MMVWWVCKWCESCYGLYSHQISTQMYGCFEILDLYAKTRACLKQLSAATLEGGMKSLLFLCLFSSINSITTLSFRRQIKSKLNLGIFFGWVVLIPLAPQTLRIFNRGLKLILMTLLSHLWGYLLRICSPFLGAIQSDCVCPLFTTIPQRRCIMKFTLLDLSAQHHKLRQKNSNATGLMARSSSSPVWYDWISQ